MGEDRFTDPCTEDDKDSFRQFQSTIVIKKITFQFPLDHTVQIYVVVLQSYSVSTAYELRTKQAGNW